MTRDDTTEKIKQAFIALLQEKAYTQITVREIASRAEVGFKTVYRRYSDKSALANEIYAETWAQLIEQIRERGLSTPPDETLRHLLTMIQENAPLMRGFVALGSYQDVLPDFVQDFAHEQLRVYRPDLYACEADHADSLQSLVTTYFMTGQVELIRWWLLQDDLSLSIDALAAMIMQLVIQPIMAVQLPDSDDDVMTG